MAQGRVGMAADVSVLAMTADLGAEVRGVDLSAPLSDACFQRMLDAFHRDCVIFLRGQRLEPRLLMRFASRFGELEMPSDGMPAIPGLPQLGVISEASDSLRGGRQARSSMHWRTDGSYLHQPPSVTVLHAVECSSHGAGGMEFANQYAAFASLPRNRRLLVEKLRGIHDGPVVAQPGRYAEHPLVRLHPATGEKALYAGKDFVTCVLGLAPDESRRMLEELETFATQPRFRYSHAWCQGDVLLWDNRCTLHRPMAFGPKGSRVLHRVQVRGESPAVT